MGSSKRIKADRIVERTIIINQEMRGLYTIFSDGEPDAELDHGSFLVFDICQDGLGLIIGRQLSKGARIRVTLGQPYLLVVEATVIWCEPSLEFDAFRCGVFVENAEEKKLKSIYERFYSNMETFKSIKTKP